MLSADVLIIGSGAAGLGVALKLTELDPQIQITIITKSEPEESNTKYAQGGVAAALKEDFKAIEQHIEDTLAAGDGLCNTQVVDFVVKKGWDRIKEIVDLGVKFNKNRQGSFDFVREGGHNQNIILHHKDSTGLEIENVLLAKIKKSENIKLLTNHLGLDLITEHHLIVKEEHPASCYGASVLNVKTGKVEFIFAKKTVIATGGIGQVYSMSTNPSVATGDGVAMAFRAGVTVTNMEFVQFHPTALYDLKESPTFLISEAVRGRGAILLDSKKQKFMHRYDEKMELACRDIVARAIDQELKESGAKHLWLDGRGISDFQKQFPSIYQKCMSKGINPTVDLIPIIPAAHYICGGIEVDMSGKTSQNHLYACGECSNTGLHGANRLASNSLLEAIVYADEVAQSIIRSIAEVSALKGGFEWKDKGIDKGFKEELIDRQVHQVKEIMSTYVGIVRSNQSLEEARRLIMAIYDETEKQYIGTIPTLRLCELRNLVTVALLIIQQSIKRKENKGVFYNEDNTERILIN